MSRGLGETCQVIADEFITWPDCEAHYDLTVENGEFYSWVWESMSSPHAPVHYWLGGAIDCDVMYNHIANLVGTDIAESLAFLSVGHRKGLYCNGIWSCEGTASVGEQPSEVGKRYKNTIAYYLDGLHGTANMRFGRVKKTSRTTPLATPQDTPVN